MKLIASIEGTSWRKQPTTSARARERRIPSIGAARNAPRNTAVPGKAKKLRAIVAGSGAGAGATGGVRITRPSSPGVGNVRALTFKWELNDGSAHRKMKTDASANGDHALRIAPTEGALSRTAGAPEPTSIVSRAFQSLRNATITSSETIAATM